MSWAYFSLVRLIWSWLPSGGAVLWAVCWPGLISIRITPTWTRFQTRKARSRFLQICSFLWQTILKGIWLNVVCGFCFILAFSAHSSSFSKYYLP